MTSDQLIEPFEIYDIKVGKYFPKTPPSDILQLLCGCGDHPVSNKEAREFLDINRFSAAKLLNKLCKAGVAQYSEPGENGSKYVLLTDHGRKVLRDLELAMAAIAATTPMQEKSSPERPQPERRRIPSSQSKSMLRFAWTSWRPDRRPHFKAWR